MVLQWFQSCFISVIISTGSTPIFWALTATSMVIVDFPVFDFPRTIELWPIGIPGIDSASCKAGENGIHFCSLNLTFDAKPLFALNLSKLKAVFSSLSAASVNDFLVLAIIQIKMAYHHLPQTNHQMHLLLIF